LNAEPWTLNPGKANELHMAVEIATRHGVHEENLNPNPKP